MLRNLWSWKCSSYKPRSIHSNTEIFYALNSIISLLCIENPLQILQNKPSIISEVFPKLFSLLVISRSFLETCHHCSVNMFFPIPFVICEIYNSLIIFSFHFYSSKRCIPQSSWEVFLLISIFFYQSLMSTIHYCTLILHTRIIVSFYRHSEGLSGRTLRKIPFLAHAYYVQVPQVSLEDFIKAMHKAVKKQVSDAKDFSRVWNRMWHYTFQ
jgi:hypothetical protein